MNVMVMRSFLLILLFSVSLPLFSMLIPATRALTSTHKGMTRRYVTKRKKKDATPVESNSQKVNTLDISIRLNGYEVSPKQLALQGLQKVQACAKEKVQACTKDGCTCRELLCKSPEYAKWYNSVPDCFKPSLYRAYWHYNDSLEKLDKAIIGHVVHSENVTSDLLLFYKELCPHAQDCAKKIMTQAFLKRTSYTAISLAAAWAGLKLVGHTNHSVSEEFLGLCHTFGLVGIILGGAGVIITPLWNVVALGLGIFNNDRELVMACYLTCKTNDIKKVLEQAAVVEQHKSKENKHRE